MKWMINAFLCALCFCFVARAEENVLAPAIPSPSVFSQASGAGAQALNATVVELLRKQKYAEAEKLLEDASKTDPTADVFYNLSCAQALQNKTDAALDSLAKSIEKGFRDAAHIETDLDLKSLHGNERFAKLLVAAREPAPKTPSISATPAMVKDGIAMVDEKNTGWDAERRVLLPQFEFDAADPRKSKDAAVGQGKAGESIRQWQHEGTAAGLFGVLYDNHDGDHSPMNAADFPQLAFVRYSAVAKKYSAHYGLQHTLFFSQPLIGNSSTALTNGPFWRSQTRIGQVNPYAISMQAQHYLSNQLYFYPEHRDYDPGRNGTGDGYGDTFPANTPYVVTSQGSSGSDQVFLRAFACAIAAMQPATQAAAVKNNLLAPTLQMVFRASNKRVATPEDYLTGKAHPMVFQGEEIGVEKMIKMAHDLKPDELPPLVQLKVVKEEAPRHGIDFFDLASSQTLFNTPCAIACIFRSTAQAQTLTVSAAGSRDANSRPLTFRWVLLLGTAARVKIEPSKENGAEATLTIQWHERFPLEPDSKMESNRVDIGVFAHNGVNWSAPAFVSFYCPDSETRKYDAKGLIESVEYISRAEGGNYADPAVYTARDWRDDYRRDAQGRICGWTRTRKGVTEDFNADGMLILEKDAAGRAKKARAVRYIAHPVNANTSPKLETQPFGEEIIYTYESDADLIGRPEKK